MSANPVVEYVRYSVAPDRGDALVEAYRRALPFLEASPHCLAADLHRCVEDPGMFVLRLEWDSVKGHLEGFRGSAQFRGFLAEVRPFLDAIVEMRHYEATGLTLRRAAAP